MIRLACALLLSAFLSKAAMAACSAAAGTTLTSGKMGEIALSVGATGATINKLMYCDGTTWQDLGGSPTATACSKNGEISLSGSELYYCNSTALWRFDSGALTNGACTKPGEIRWNATQLEFCNGSNWRVVSADSSVDALTNSTASNLNIEAQTNAYFLISGWTGGSGTITMDNGGGTCTGLSARICTDTNPTCASIGNIVTTGGTLLTIPNGSYLRLAGYTSTQPLTTCSITAVVGGQTVSYSWSTTATDSAPLFGAVTDSTGNAPNTLVTSNIFKVSSHTGVTGAISDSGLGGSPEFRVCADATCSTVDVTWGTASQPLANPKYIQFRVTTGSTSLDLKKITFTAGTGTTYWQATTSTCPTSTISVASGASTTCTCPVGSLSLRAPTVQGSGNYKQANSNVCVAAIHSGALTNAAGGSITVKGNTSGSPAGTCSSFSSSTANGVASASGTIGTSYYFNGAGTDVCN